ncbi:hypothetical protein ID866_2325 [Astraeus odoratus]|nr:hypothetical protein ID866_2325 [Astraeus odoratus]
MAGCPSAVTTTEQHRLPEETDQTLNCQRCYVKQVGGKGRGVFGTTRIFLSSRVIPPRTVIETSPVLLFTREEYDSHGRHTLLDHYTFNWRDGRMALALGLGASRLPFRNLLNESDSLQVDQGSLFNHSELPNVSYSIDTARDCIVYTSSRTIYPDEELCIFYGHKLWFDPVDMPNKSGPSHITTEPNGVPDEWGGLETIQESHLDLPLPTTSIQEGMDDIMGENELPFSWKKLSLDKEEEVTGDVELVQAWVVDIPVEKDISPMLKWLKHSGLDTDNLSHLKRIRRQGPSSTLLLGISPQPPALPGDITLGALYQVPVPCNPALTQTSLNLKNTFWPTVFTPRRKWEPEKWTRRKLKWACDAVEVLKKECLEAVSSGELPVVAHIPRPFANEGELPQSFLACDTRTSAGHPLRHATLNIIRKVADFRTAQPTPSRGEGAWASPTQNGAQYLLTGLTLFITHEPCIMCTMALLHSRVKEVFYLRPMPRTGGCGGAACIPALKGVNHRFTIAVWKEDIIGNDEFLSIVTPEMDA